MCSHNPQKHSKSALIGLLFRITMLAGIYMGATYGGSISAILLNCPGAAEAACTAINGNLMAKAGRAKEALLYSVIASGIGGFAGCLVLLFFTPVLAGLALKFGPPEMFLVCFGGLAIVGSLMGDSLAKGFFAVAVGILLSLVGVDNLSGNYRFTMHSLQLSAGLNLVPVVVGLFAVSEMLSLLGKAEEENGVERADTGKVRQRQIWWTILIREWWMTLKSSLIGIVIGILPGTGGAIASFVAYGEARRVYGDNPDFGKNKGDERGIIAPEAANNGAVGGSMVPLPPVLIAMILGQMLEENLRRSLMIAGAKKLSVMRYVFVRPVALVLMAVVGILIFVNFKIALRKNNSE